VPDDGLGPLIGKGQANPGAVHGGDYAPYVVERWTRVQGSELTIYYLLSTWKSLRGCFDEITPARPVVERELAPKQETVTPTVELL
jgi:hypothetical protein